MTPDSFLPKHQVPSFGGGIVLGCFIMAILISVGLSIGCTPSIWFGIPHQ